MRRKTKTILYATGGVILLGCMFILVKAILNRQISGQIPELNDVRALTQIIKSQISEAGKKAKRKPTAENLGMLGMIYHSSANYMEASKCYELAVDRDQSQWIWNYYLGYLHMEMGESESAIENFNRVIQIDHENHFAWYYCGESYANLGDYGNAERCFGRIPIETRSGLTGSGAIRVDYFSLGTYAKYQLSRIYLNSGRLEQAERSLKEIIQIEGLFGQAYRLLGNVYHTKGDASLGDYYRLKAIELMNVSEPVDTLIDRLVLLSRSDLYILKRIDEATRTIYPDWTLEIIDHGIKYLSDNKHLVTKAIETWLWTDQIDKASDYAESHFGFFEESYAELYDMGSLFFSKGLLKESVLYYSRLMELKPEVLDNYKTLAICHWHLGDRRKSLEILNQTVELYPGNLNVLAYYTDILIFELGAVDVALPPFEVLIERAPTVPKVQKIAARFAEHDGDLKRAVALYEASFNGDPEDELTITLLGNLLVRQKMWKRSIQLFRTALEYHPNNPVYLERLGTLLVMSPDLSVRNIEEGLEYAERAFTNVASSTTIRVSSGKSLSLAYAMQGEKQMANSILSGVIRIARHEEIPESELAELEELSAQFEKMEDKIVLLTE